MKLLIAEDDVTSRVLLEHTLKRWGYDVISTTNGKEALEVLLDNDPPRLAILDWMMPEMDGQEVCRLVRQNNKIKSTYLILLTAKASNEDLISGLDAGADDYIMKPFDKDELHARIKAGQRISELQDSLAKRIDELQDAMDQIKTLKGIIPICSYCKKIRDDKNYWQQVEHYVTHHSDAEFSHGVCPDCYKEHVTPQLKEIRGVLNKNSSED